MAATTEIERLLVSIVGDATQYEAALRRAIASTKQFSANASYALAGLGAAIAAPIIAFGTKSVAAFSKFDQAMTESLAIMKVTDKQIQELKEQALELSTKGPQGPEKLARSYYYLASAGFSTSQVLTALPVIQNFATAGMFDLEQATTLAADAQSALGMRSADATRNMEQLRRVTDVLVHANILANATTQDFSKSITTKFGSALRSVNKDIEEGAAVLAAYAEQGIKARLAGETGFRLIRMLSKTATEHAPEHARLGLRVYDAAGDFRNIADVVQDFERILMPLSDELKATTLAQLGFEARVQASILPLLGMSSKIREYEATLRKAGGTAKEVAEKQMLSFNNQMIVMRNNLNLVGVEIGSIIAPALRVFADGIGIVVRWFRELSPETKRTIVFVGSLIAAFGTLLVTLSALSLISSFIAPSLFAIAFLLPNIGGMIALITRPLALIPLTFKAMQLSLLGFSTLLQIVLYPLIALPTIIAAIGRGLAALNVGWTYISLAIQAVWIWTGRVLRSTLALLNPIRLIPNLISGVASVIAYIPTALSLIPKLLYAITMPLGLISGLATAASGAIAIMVAGLAAVAAIAAAISVAEWVESVGGIASAWEIVKKKLAETWEWLKPVRQAMTSLFRALWDVASSVFNALRRQAAELFGGLVIESELTWDEVRDGMRDAVIAMEFGIRNFGQVWDFALAGIRLSVVTFANNFSQIMGAVIRLGISLFGALVDAIVRLFESIDWEVVWDGLVTGAKAAAQAAFNAVKSPFEDRKFSKEEIDRLKKFVTDRENERYKKEIATLITPEDRSRPDVYRKLVDHYSQESRRRLDTQLASVQRTPAAVELQMKQDKKSKMKAGIDIDVGPATKALKQFAQEMQEIWDNIGDPETTPPFEKQLREEFNQRKADLKQSFEEFRAMRLKEFEAERVQGELERITKWMFPGDKAQDAVNAAGDLGKDIGEHLTDGFIKEIKKLDAALVDSAEGMERYYEYLRNLETIRSSPGKMAMEEEILEKRWILERSRLQAPTVAPDITKPEALPNVPQGTPRPEFEPAPESMKAPIGDFGFDAKRIAIQYRQTISQITADFRMHKEQMRQEGLERDAEKLRNMLENLRTMESGKGPIPAGSDALSKTGSTGGAEYRPVVPKVPLQGIPHPIEIKQRTPNEVPRVTVSPPSPFDEMPKKGPSGSTPSNPLYVKPVQSEDTVVRLLTQIRDAVFTIAKKPVPEATRPADLGR